MKLKLVKSDILDDWYTIERAEHDGKEWWEKTGPDSSSFRMSCRIGDACVEGTRTEMLAIAKAILSGEFKSFRRCAVCPVADGYEFYSPRNTADPGPTIPYESAKDLAIEILDTL